MNMGQLAIISIIIIIIIIIQELDNDQNLSRFMVGRGSSPDTQKLH